MQICIDKNQNALTLVDSWLERLMTWSLASHSSRFSRRTSFAWRSSADPYKDEPPDKSDAALPCTIQKNTKPQITFKLKPHSLYNPSKKTHHHHSFWGRWVYAAHSAAPDVWVTADPFRMTGWVVWAMLVDSMALSMAGCRRAHSRTALTPDPAHGSTSTDTFFRIWSIWIREKRR